MFVTIIVSDNYRRRNNLLCDFVYNYSDEIIKVSRQFGEVICEKGYLYRFISISAGPHKLKGLVRNKDLVLHETDFREMYSLK